MRGGIRTWVLGGVVVAACWPRAGGAATIVVDTLADDADPATCSLRDAIRSANPPNAAFGGCPAGSAGADTVILPHGVYTLALAGTGEELSATGDLDIREGLTIQGHGAPVTIIDGGAIDRVFHVDPEESAISVELRDLTIRNGLSPLGDNGAGIFNLAGGNGHLVLKRVVVTANEAADPGDSGVGVNNRGLLTVVVSEISANGGAGAAGIFNENGGNTFVIESRVIGNTSPTQAGGIDNQGMMTITRSLIAGNTATQFQGGGVLNNGQLMIRESTLGGNAAGTVGGALYNDAAGTADLKQVTIADNTAAMGGGVFNENSLDLDHTLLADNAGGNCAGTNAPLSLGYNLEDGTTCNLSQTGDQAATDPELGPLADNGAFTSTYALTPGSPAVDAGDPSTPTVGADQRFVRRGLDGDGDGIGVQDVGAFELDFPIVVNTTGDGLDALPDDGVCEVVVGSGICTLRAAVQTHSSHRIQLPAGTFVLSIPGSGEDESASGDLDAGLVRIQGAGVDVTVIEGQAEDRIFDAGTLWLEISDLTLRGGSATGDSGGCIRNDTSEPGLILKNVRLEGCSADDGGAIFLEPGAVATLSDSTISGNQAALSGGGIGGANDSLLLIERSLLHGNQATNLGGGLFVGLLAVVNSTLSANTADEAGALFTNNVTFIGSSTLAHNTATGGTGGALVPGGVDLFLHNSIVAANVGSPGSENCAGIGPSVLFSRGFNLESENSCMLAGPGDQPSADPKLVPLADNGGPTRTHALALSSAAIDMGDPAACPPTDQRGIVRPEDGDGVGGAACDIGAFEGLACQPLVLADHTIDSAVDYTACESITLRNLVFGSGADADLTAGNRLIAENGTVFAAGSQAVLAIDPALGMAPP